MTTRGAVLVDPDCHLSPTHPTLTSFTEPSSLPVWHEPGSSGEHARKEKKKSVRLVRFSALSLLSQTIPHESRGFETVNVAADWPVGFHPLPLRPRTLVTPRNRPMVLRLSSHRLLYGAHQILFLHYALRPDFSTSSLSSRVPIFPPCIKESPSRWLSAFRRAEQACCLVLVPAL